MTRAQDDVLDLPDLRRRSNRQVRHTAREELHQACWDAEMLEDAVLPVEVHDIGRKSSPPPKKAPKPGRRKGFKVWKTPYWKRRRKIWAEQNAEIRRLAEQE